MQELHHRAASRLPGGPELTVGSSQSEDPESRPGSGAAGAPSEEELRARLEEELRKIHVRDVLLQTVVTLVNLGGQRLGLSEGTRDQRDLSQASLAIEAVRALLPLLESDEEIKRSVGPVRDALSQLQLAYAREAGAAAPEQPPEGEPAREPGGRTEPPDAPPRRSSGRLWTPPGSA